ncbi:MAG TPA: pyridoxamine 5'-phosphate oxidase, partial [Sediminibacterium sp.]|nr:pyridoxamine 5'-phosphate oxidase [Sediminibacterium sp.]
DEKEMAYHPIDQFARWWEEATHSEIDEVNAMTLATATPGGLPSARIVLLKGFDQRGFIFFTNYESHKGRELDHNPRASLIFFWKELERQVRIEGLVERLPSEESDAYFASRPRGSQLGAWASQQSTVIPDRAYLEKRMHDLEVAYQERPIPRPPHWGGFLVKPLNVEFWQGRSSRLHDRIRYVLERGHNWAMQRLAP